MNSAIVSKLKTYAENYQVDISQVEDITQEIKSFYWSLTSEVNNYSSLISFAITPIIDEDPLSRFILQGFIDRNPELQDEMSSFHFNNWDEAVLCYYVVKHFMDFIKKEYKERTKTDDEYEIIYRDQILLDALLMAVCSSSMEELHSKAYPNEDGFFKYVVFLSDY